ncbi:sodium-dependent bicarbonate transport family permease [Waterburya agarophytonicola K14]|uniref:Sodium-dependent bicarbonate transport family permease n=1 Tax=Waterburya agarophytonicola KI4 TaxID=2874699 RepID=A0A964BWH5_9CYAN|nr:sodium-dependent bicarbonate transport family permease [Waterburya agarophytonicola]MCC0178835.1 sodium-dependent bicarbonate transport family permease [Waterburya agarophytonicola KI4]
MDGSLILFNLLNPPVLFFFLGMTAVFVKSDLEIPAPLPKLFSLYLLIAIGFKGGHELSESGINLQISITLIAAVVMAALVPIYTFFILRTKLDSYNSAAIAATYGSISAVTFITASSFLEKLQIPYGGHMVAALALMESPAIVVGIILVKMFAENKKLAVETIECQGMVNTELDSSQYSASSAMAITNQPAFKIKSSYRTQKSKKDKDSDFSWSEVLREAFLNASVLLLVGSLMIGVLTGEEGWTKLEPFTQGIFYGALTFFLLDMGLVAARRIKDLGNTGSFLICFSVFIPVLNALVGIGIAKVLGFTVGNALLFAVLCASASYIAVPAAMRMTVPQANPSLYVSMALALTFPFNIIVGIPLYLEIIKHLFV